MTRVINRKSDCDHIVQYTVDDLNHAFSVLRYLSLWVHNPTKHRVAIKNEQISSSCLIAYASDWPIYYGSSYRENIGPILSRLRASDVSQIVKVRHS